MLPFFRLLSLLGFLLYSLQGQAQEELYRWIDPGFKLTPAQASALKRELKIQEIFIKGVKEIQLSGGKIVSIDRAVSSVESMLESSFEVYAKGKAPKLPPNSGAIKAVLAKARDFATGQVSAQSKGLSAAARRWGMGVGLVYVLSAQVSTTYPLIMMSMGHMEYATLLAAPVTGASTAGYIAFQNAVKFKHLINTMGGLSGVKRYREVLKRVRRYFKTSVLSTHNLIDFHAAGKRFALTLDNGSIMAKIKRALGYTSGIQSEELFHFMRSQELLTPVIEDIYRSPIDSKVKTLAMLRSIELQAEPKTVAKLKARFGAFLNEIENVGGFNQARRWVAEISNAPSMESFTKLMMSMPDDIPPRVFDKLWRKHILPGAAKSVTPYFGKENFQTFRNLVNKWETSRKPFIHSLESGMQPEMKSLLADYFFASVSNAGGCGAIFRKRGDFAPLL